MGRAAQWTSSSTTTSGRPPPAAASQVRTASKSRCCSISGLVDRGASSPERRAPISGTSRVSSAGAPEPIGQLRVGDAGHVPLQRFEEGLVGDGEVLVAPTEEHDASGRVDPMGDLRGQPGLSDPGLAEDEEHGQPVPAGVGEHALGQLELGGPGDEGP